MYRKDSTGWIKHVDFILLDLICLQVAFVLAYALSGYGANPYRLILYRNMAVFMEVADLVVLFAMGTLKNVLKREYYKDFVVTAQHGVILGACLLLYLFMLQEGHAYSRLALILNIVIYILLTYLVRELWKHLLRKEMEDGENRSLLLVVSADVGSAVVESMKEHNYARYKIAGIAVIDKEMTGKYINGVKVVANMENAAEYVCKEWIDEVLIVTSGVVPYPKELIEQFTETGVTVHLNLAKVQSVPGKKQLVEKVGDYTVLTTSINYASTRDLMLKRLMDIAGGLVGCLITGILFIFVAPAIYIASPGPIFFAQERVGKNGKRFKMYKFRSMYMDAEERKAELMKDNKLGDEKMFKLDFDPRVIGNKILPDGTHMYLHYWCRPTTFAIKEYDEQKDYLIYADTTTDKPFELTPGLILKRSRRSKVKYYAKVLWFNRKKITWERIVFNVKGMLLLYFLGSYIRKYSLDERFDKKSLLKILIATTALNVLLNSLISIATGGKPHIPFARDCSVFIVIEATVLMMFFMKVEFHSDFINRVAKHVFAVYLFEGALRQIVQNIVFDYSIYEGEWYWPLVNIAVALIAMVGCMSIDVLAQWMLKPFRKAALKMLGVIINISQKIFICY